MKRMTMIRTFAVILALLLTAVFGPQGAYADPESVPDVSGHWTGSMQSTLEVAKVALLDIVVERPALHEARGKELEAKATLQFDNLTYLGKGRIHLDEDEDEESWTLHAGFEFESNNEVKIPRLEFEGDVIDLGDGRLGVHARYIVGPRGHQADGGTLISVQSLGRQSWSDLVAPDVTGCWMGSFANGNAFQPMSALFTSEVGTSLRGDLTIVRDYQFVGTISPNGSIFGLALGSVPTVQYIAISAQFIPANGLAAARISGTIRIVYIGGRMEDHAFSLNPCFFEDF